MHSEDKIYRARARWGRRIADLRLVLHLSQAHFARLAGITLQRCSRLERGHAIPTPDEIQALSHALSEATRAAVVNDAPPLVRATCLPREVPAAPSLGPLVDVGEAQEGA